MKKKIISVLIILIIILFSNISYAYVLTLNMECLENNIKVGDEFEIKLDWKDGMQAADFSLYYDNDKVEYLGADIEEGFLQKNKEFIKIAWFSTNNKDKTSITFKFKAIDEGEVEFETIISGGFATGNLKKPDRYENELFEIQIKPSYSLLKIIIISIIILVLIYLVILKKQRRKK